MTNSPPETRFHFASDNTSGFCPEALAAFVEANEGYVPSYGTDEHTTRACDLLREFFETDCEIFFVFNGTAANSLSLASLCASYHSVIAHELAHVETDECGAPEFFSNGSKLLLAGGKEGKLEPAELERLVTRRSDIHYPRPRALSISQPTELGTVYSLEEIRTVCEVARRHKLRVHMDGARFFNALVALNATPAEMTWKAGVDVLCLGGTKAGIGTSEAVVFFDKALAEEFAYRCKQAGQLASKMRFLAAPWQAVLQDGVWRRNAENANRMAARLAEAAAAVPGVTVARTPQANAVFLRLDPEVHLRLDEAGWKFYGFIGLSEWRFMCSWKTTEKDIARLVADMGGL